MRVVNKSSKIVTFLFNVYKRFFKISHQKILRFKFFCTAYYAMLCKSVAL